MAPFYVLLESVIIVTKMVERDRHILPQINHARFIDIKSFNLKSFLLLIT